MGYPGDPQYSASGTTRPAWSKDGSIMVFRKLEQLVPEFQNYLATAGPKWRQWLPGTTVAKIQPPLSDAEGAALWGARMVGRWPSVSCIVCGREVVHDPVLHRALRWQIRLIARTLVRQSQTKRTTSTTVSKAFSALPIKSVHSRRTSGRRHRGISIRMSRDPSSKQRWSFVRAWHTALKCVYALCMTPASHDTTKSLKFSGHGAGATIQEDHRETRIVVCVLPVIDFERLLATDSMGWQRLFPHSLVHANQVWCVLSIIMFFYRLDRMLLGQDPIIGSPAPKKTIVKAQGPIPDGEISLEVENTSPGVATVVVDGFSRADVAPVITEDYFVNSRGGEYFFVPSISIVRSWSGRSPTTPQPDPPTAAGVYRIRTAQVQTNMYWELKKQGSQDPWVALSPLAVSNVAQQVSQDVLDPC